MMLINGIKYACSFFGFDIVGRFTLKTKLIRK